MPHLDAAHSLARFLTRNDSDAQDMVQEACLRAYRYFDSFEGDNPSGWLMAIVRNVCFAWIQHSRRAEIVDADTIADDAIAIGAIISGTHGRELEMNPETQLIEDRDHTRATELLQRLPAEYREAIVLREIDDLSYQEIADLTGVPIGTVMSRLARARKMLHDAWHRTQARKLSPHTIQLETTTALVVS